MRFVPIFLIAGILITIVVFIMVSVLQQEGIIGPNSNRKIRKSKIRQLEADKIRLETENAQLRSQNERLDAELVAHRHQLPWVDVEELDGTQE